MSVSEPPPADSRPGERARASFHLGMASFLLCVFTGVPAVWKGVRSLVEMRGDPDRRGERRLARAGIILGLLGSVPGIFLVVRGVNKVQQASLRTGII
jgi:uncharacterized membrane protein HdeD (DUF308 family)